MTYRDVPEKYRVLYEKAKSGQSRSAGIKAFCLECCNWDFNEVANCSDSGCPLFSYRPYKVETPPLRGGVLDSESILSLPGAYLDSESILSLPAASSGIIETSEK